MKIGKTKSLFKILFLLSIIVLSIGCDDSIPTIPQTENGNFTLYISNQSSNIDPVDIKVIIDGQIAVNQEFLNSGGHNWIKFQFQLKKGKHLLFASSAKGNLKQDSVFTVDSKLYGVVDYWFYPGNSGNKEFKKFIIIFSETGIDFL